MSLYDDHADYFAHRDAMGTVGAVVARYRLTIAGPTVQLSHSDLDASLPPLTVQLRAGDEQLLIHSPGWAGRLGALEVHVRTWIIEHVELRGSSVRPSRRHDRQWLTAWRAANPHAW